MDVAALILAAGASRRLGQPKQLIELDRETLLARAVRLSREAGARRVVVVLGCGAEEVGVSLCHAPAQLVVNQDWEKGIASSIHAGLHAIEELARAVEGVLILTCDQPRVTAEHLAAMLVAFRGSGGSALVGSAYEGIVGVPALFPRAAFAELYTLQGDEGARAILKEGRWPLHRIDLAGGEVDIDFAEDLNRLK